jgi:hypothetical protein
MVGDFCRRDNDHQVYLDANSQVAELGVSVSLSLVHGKIYGLIVAQK